MKRLVRRLRFLLTAWRQASARQAPLLAAGVAFYGFTSLFPALIATVSIYGLVASPATISRQVDQVSELLPADAASLITGQIEGLAASTTSSLGFSAAIALVAALWSASAGIGNLVTAVNSMFGLAEDRSFIARKGLSLGLTVGAVVFVVVLVSLAAALPAVLNVVDVVPGVRVLVEIGRWIVLLAVVLGAVATLYRLAPNRPSRTGFLSRGVVLAAGIWVAVSIGFSVYVDNFGSYSATYGALAGVVVLLLWLWLGVYAILIGACIEAVSEQVVTADTVAIDQEIAQQRTDEIREAVDAEGHRAG